MDNKLFQIKKPDTSSSINPIIESRWSPRAFNPNSNINSNQLRSIFEAARWTASSHNTQPWRFIVGIRGDKTFNSILNGLVDFNKLWACNASVLILSLVDLSDNPNDKTRLVRIYDLGQSVSSMVFQAQTDGIYTHQMSGFDNKLIESTLNIDDNYISISVIAMGILDDPENVLKPISNDIYSMEINKRERRGLENTVYAEWKTPFDFNSV